MICARSPIILSMVQQRVDDALRDVLAALRPVK
jgi:hypothetical protein